MGLIERIFSLLFGSGRNVVRETAEVFRENAEGAGQRAAERRSEAMAQFGDEFVAPRRGWFDRLMDAVNRVPRPAMALGTLGLFIAAMTDPVWFAARMQGIALVPEPLWWLLTVIVGFYFGARHQVKGQEFQRAIMQSMARVPRVLDNLDQLRAITAGTPGAADTRPDAPLAQNAIRPGANPALEDWRRSAR
jgi:hypothetical protein